MNKKELIKLLDKYEIEYEITDNTKEVEEGLRLFDEALEKIGIAISKGTRVDTITTENDLEVPRYTTEWASSSDLISRQAAIEALGEEPDITLDTDEEWAERDTWARHIRAIESLPPVEPPKKVVAQIKVDTDEIIERIKEEYEITDRPVCDDAISRQALIDEILEDGNGAVLSYTKGMDEDELVERIEEQMIKHFIGVIEYAPPVEPERPKGKWKIKECDSIYGKKYILTCPECGESVSVTKEALPHENFCRECGADMRGEEECG